MGLKIGSEGAGVHLGRGRNRVLIVSPNLADPNILWEVDFTTLTPGAGGTLPKSLLFSRAAIGATETVQTSASTMLASGLGVDVPRIGQYGTDATTRGLVVEHGHGAHGGQSRDFSSAGVAAPGGYWSAPGPTPPTVTGNYAAGPDGVSSADRVQLTVNAMALYEGAVSTNLMSVWARATGSSDTLTAGIQGQAALSESLTGEWKRLDFLGHRGFGASSWDIYERGLLTGSPNTSRDLVLDYKNLKSCNTTQNGTSYRFLGETIPVLGTARQGERLYLASIGDILDSTRLSLWFQVIPKGDAGDYGANMTLWHRDANYLAFINSVTRVVTVTVNGSSFSTAGAIAFSRKDVLDIWVEAGGGSLVTTVKYRVNGGATVNMGSSGAAQAAINSGSQVSLLSTSAADKQLSSWVQVIRAYKNNTRPAWAA